jgi:hypothetical protein
VGRNPSKARDRRDFRHNQRSVVNRLSTIQQDTRTNTLMAIEARPT